MRTRSAPAPVPVVVGRGVSAQRRPPRLSLATHSPTGSCETSRYHNRHRETRRVRHRRQSPRVQQAAQFVRDAAPPESVDRGLELAGVLSQLQADDDLLLAGLLVPCIGSLDSRRPASPRCSATRPSDSCANCDASTTAASRPAGTRAQPLKPAQAEGLRKLLLSLASDVRLVLLRLALQLVRLRHLKDAPDDGAAARRARDPRDLRAAREPPRHLAREVGARGPRLPLQPARGLQAHRRLAALEARRARALHRGRARASSRASSRRSAWRPRSPAARSTSTASGGRCSARASPSSRSWTCSRCACRSRRSPSATRRSASCTACGRTSRASSTTTSPRPRRTTTARCTPR